MKRRVAPGSLIIALLPCCVSVLGLDEYTDAVEALCKCDGPGQVPQLGGDCVEVLSDRLNNVSEQSRAAWLTTYEQDCDADCTRAYDCYQATGTCAKVSCTEDRECCGYSEGGMVRCLNTNKCGTCSAENGPCNDAEDCCDSALGCLDNKCQDDAMPPEEDMTSSAG